MNIEFKNNTNSVSLFDNIEMINIWIGNLLNKHNKRLISQLLANEIEEEIEEVKGTIENEILWSLAEPIHKENVKTLNLYLDKLVSILNNVDNYDCIDDVVNWMDTLPKRYNKQSIDELSIDDLKEEIECAAKIKEIYKAGTVFYYNSLNTYICNLEKLLKFKEKMNIINGGN